MSESYYTSLEARVLGLEKIVGRAPNDNLATELKEANETIARLNAEADRLSEHATGLRDRLSASRDTVADVTTHAQDALRRMTAHKADLWTKVDSLTVERDAARKERDQWMHRTIAAQSQAQHMIDAAFKTQEELTAVKTELALIKARDTKY